MSWECSSCESKPVNIATLIKKFESISNNGTQRAESVSVVDAFAQLITPGN